MPLPNNINAYADVKVVLEAMAGQLEARYTLPTHGAAVKWRQRAYTYRKLLQKQVGDRVALFGHTPTTPYDAMTIFIQDCTCIIKIVAQPAGVLQLPDGTRLQPQIETAENIPEPKPEATDEDILAMAAKLMEKDE